jgi:RNA polymerase sigma factor (sigma-70 family)
MDDEALLREYVERRSERAFAELVARYLPLVHGVAVRVVGERQAAQDVAQGVFVQLARKAWMVRTGGALPGWLYRAARRRAINASRGEQRRRQREAAAMSGAEQSTEPERGERPVAWEELAPWLEEAMGQLARVEQDAVVLRFFQGKSLRETGEALAMSEEAARKRVTRGLEKMRGYFARRGVMASGALLAEAIGAKAAPVVPVGLAAAVAEASLAGAGSAGVGVAGLLVKLFFMTTKTKMGLIAVAVVLAVAAVPLAMNWWEAGAPEPVEAPLQVAVVAPMKAKTEDGMATSTAGTPGGGNVTAQPGAQATVTTPAKASPAPTVRAKPWVQGMYMVASDWVNAGQDTPEDALQTYLWAKKNGNKVQLDAMTKWAPDVVIEMGEEGKMATVEEGIKMSYAVQNARAALQAQFNGSSGSATTAEAAGSAAGTDGQDSDTEDSAPPTAVKPGVSPYDPEMLRAMTLAAYADPNMTEPVMPQVTPQTADYSRLSGGTMVSRQEISPSEVQFTVSEEYVPMETGQGMTQTDVIYDFTLGSGGWKATLHNLVMKNVNGIEVEKAMNNANGVNP